MVIATPDFLHMEHAIAALQAGKPALLQKPMARSAAECAQIRGRPRDWRALFVSFMHRYLEEVEHLQGCWRTGCWG